MKSDWKRIFAFVVVAGMLMPSGPACAQSDSTADLAHKLENPIADLISVPLQSNWDFGSGRAKAMRYTLNVEPVIPISLGKDWNLVTRTINVKVSQVLKLGPQPIQLQLGGRYYAERPAGGPAWGIRFAIIFLFPK